MVSEHVPKQAKSLIEKMLTVNPNRRPTANQVLADPWIQGQYPEDSANNSLMQSNQKVIFVTSKPLLDYWISQSPKVGANKVEQVQNNFQLTAEEDEVRPEQTEKIETN